jgi:Tol biopolymer transport system component
MAQAQLAYLHDGNLWLTGAEGPGEQITQEGGITDFAWSPDSEMLVYVRSTGGDWTLYVMPADSSQPPRSLGAGYAPGWSPDGDRIAFGRANQLYVVNLDGSGERRLTPDDEWVWGNPVFSADGASVIAGGANRHLMGAQGNTEFFLYSIPADGGQPAQLPNLSEPFNGRLPYDLTLSPDGAHLAFITSWHLSACLSPSDYYVLGSDGSGAHSVMPEKLSVQTDPAKDIALWGTGYAWGPEGDRLALGALLVDCSGFYTGDPAPILGPTRIYIVNVEGELLGEIDKPGSELTWSADGARLAYVARTSPIDPEGAIFTLAADGGDERAVGPGLRPAWQPGER